MGPCVTRENPYLGPFDLAGSDVLRSRPRRGIGPEGTRFKVERTEGVEDLGEEESVSLSRVVGPLTPPLSLLTPVLTPIRRNMGPRQDHGV